MTYIQRLGTSIAAGSLLMSAFMPLAFADTDVTIQGNGAHSTNNVSVTKVCVTAVTQVNNLTVGTNINVTQNTGENSANQNTGAGDIDVSTGNTTSNASVNVTGGDNEASVDSCCCPSDTSVELKHNGAHSDNEAVVTSTSTVTHTQTSAMTVGTNLSVSQKTGKNKVNKNTGTGSKTVTTGKAKSKIKVTVTGGSNVLNP